MSIIKPTIGGGGLDLKQVPAILGGTGVSQFSGRGQDVFQPTFGRTRGRGDQFSFQGASLDTFQSSSPGLILDVSPRGGQRGGQRGATSPILNLRDIQDVGQTPKSASAFQTSTRRTLTPKSPPTPFFGFDNGFGIGPSSPEKGSKFRFPPLPGLPTFGSGRAPKRRGKKRKTRIGTSLTGEFLFATQGVTGFLPQVKDIGVLGITPGQTRLRRRVKVAKKKKKG